MVGYGKEIHGLMKVLSALQDAGELMMLQHAQVLLAISLQPGITAQELMRTTGQSQSSISRLGNTLGEWHKPGVPGLKLVESHDDPRERRRKVYFLTSKGVSRMTKVLETVTGGPVDFHPVLAKEGLSRL